MERFQYYFEKDKTFLEGRVANLYRVELYFETSKK